MVLLKKPQDWRYKSKAMEIIHEELLSSRAARTPVGAYRTPIDSLSRPWQQVINRQHDAIYRVLYYNSHEDDVMMRHLTVAMIPMIANTKTSGSVVDTACHILLGQSPTKAKSFLRTLSVMQERSVLHLGIKNIHSTIHHKDVILTMIDIAHKCALTIPSSFFFVNCLLYHVDPFIAD
jgi:hypothetical protein